MSCFIQYLKVQIKIPTIHVCVVAFNKLSFALFFPCRTDLELIFFSPQLKTVAFNYNGIIKVVDSGDFRAVGTFARALDCSSSVRQPSLHMSAAAASRDITLVPTRIFSLTRYIPKRGDKMDWLFLSISPSLVSRHGHPAPARLRPFQRSERPGSSRRTRVVPRRDGGVELFGGEPVRGGAGEIRQGLQRHPARLCEWLADTSSCE